MLTSRLLRLKRLLGASHTLSMVDPVGWDEEARRVHDCEMQPNGRLLHFSTCWCRSKTEGTDTNG